MFLSYLGQPRYASWQTLVFPCPTRACRVGCDGGGQGTLLYWLLVTGSVVLVGDRTNCAVDFFKDVVKGYTSVGCSADVGTQEEALLNNAVRFPP